MSKKALIFFKEATGRSSLRNKATGQESRPDVFCSLFRQVFSTRSDFKFQVSRFKIVSAFKFPPSGFQPVS